MTNPECGIGGVDSHKDTIHVAVITAVGRPVADREFPTTEGGYRRAVAWLIEHGPLQAVGIEGTSSYGVGITAALRRNGIQVVEVNRTRPAERRKQGKTDRLDAYRAARSVISGEATTHPQARHDRISARPGGDPPKRQQIPPGLLAPDRLHLDQRQPPTA